MDRPEIVVKDPRRVDDGVASGTEGALFISSPF
jgi:hypothetical protein